MCCCLKCEWKSRWINLKYQYLNIFAFIFSKLYALRPKNSLIVPLERVINTGFSAGRAEATSLWPLAYTRSWSAKPGCTSASRNCWPSSEHHFIFLLKCIDLICESKKILNQIPGGPPPEICAQCTEP